ncbi:hypothetical protein K2173_007206 [Erythroxylum novogranatense]|uniref:F-box domain-containing protein n=1 Tax=Erythroxylum novogranatense TaxID=1862640 RepID=A0AAV8SYM3_9ROSI|nr:hypothetical protein K2173_007206 [Erythroxylum novogranatense]
MSVYLPEEIMEQILARLPPRAALRCGATSKQVYSLINRSGFISKTLSYTLLSRNPSSQVFILSNHRDLGSSICSLYLDPYTVDDYIHDIPSPFPTDKAYRCKLIDSIHGLVCVVVKFVCPSLDPAEIYIWNPLIRRYIKTPKCSLIGSDPRLVFGFGFDSIRNDYKVIVIGCHREVFSEFRIQLYSSKEGSWRDINEQWLNSSGIYLSKFPSRRFLNGVIHWLALGEDDESLILCFDVSRETFKTMKLPYNDLYRTKLFQIGESLACFHRHAPVFGIWLMEDYGVESSWTKIYSFEYPGFSPSILGIKEDGDFLMASHCLKRRKELFWFNTENCAITETGIRVHPFFLHLSSYTQSLILMDKESGALSC